MKVFVIHKNTLIIYGLAIILICGVLTFNWDTTISVFSALSLKRDLPIYYVDRQDKAISISFDAAWGNEDTQDLINILEQYKVKTTFFVVGGWVDKYPESVKALSDAGHEIMNHSNTHPHMTQLSVEKMKEEIKKCDDKIEAITGKRPFLFRPPYGDYNDKVVQACREMGHYTIQWDVDSLDWKELGVDAIVERVTKRVKSGSIVLFHNAAKYTPAALPKILDTLQKEGYKIVPISELIYRDNYHIDHTGKQIPNNKDKTSVDKHIKVDS
ncbi:MAG: polysaccharide deacetylase [Clostridia bacterium]|jgi:polysaccharide deacetylase family sporulation protein PdaB|uniref:polysaccharide deacetylase family protein n=1 Tax=Petroclostridium xylanilyticum TaxID=1792311 RepID=UPI000B98031E|nr:polysaccharide deacetylase family protein [Petroclostridium xylanilyticum]MBZ4646361.1 polysaccharide deacetylase [Clostridia bacterium]